MSNLTIGKYTYGTPTIYFNDFRYKILIGNFCSLAGGLKIFMRANHRTDWVTTYPFGHLNKDVFNTFSGQGHPACKGDVIIGNDVWIGGNVTIMSGVKIGDGAVIANNSHVVKDVEPFAIYGGNPARFIKYRFSKEQIQSLLQISWWFWTDEKINKFVPKLCSGDIDEFIRDASDESNV